MPKTISDITKKEAKKRPTKQEVPKKKSKRREKALKLEPKTISKPEELEHILKKPVRLPKRRIKEEGRAVGIWSVLFLMFCAIIISIAGTLYTQHNILPWLLTTETFQNNETLVRWTEKTTIIEHFKEIQSPAKSAENTLTTITTIAPSLMGISNTEGTLVASAIIMTTDGILLAPSKDLASDQTYTATSKKGKDYPVTIKDINTDLGLALLTIEGENLPFITIADTQNIKVGDYIVAAKYEQNADDAIAINTSLISTLKTQKVSSELEQQLLQPTIKNIYTGELQSNLPYIFNTKGELIGIRAATLESEESGPQFYDMNMLRSLVTQAISTSVLHYPRTGLSAQPITEGLKKQKELTQEKGLYIIAISPDSPAEKAELQEGDIIISINNILIEKDNTLAGMLKQYNINDTLTLLIERGEETKELTLVLE